MSRRFWISLCQCRSLDGDLSPLDVVALDWIESIDPHIISFSNIGGFGV